MLNGHTRVDTKKVRLIDLDIPLRKFKEMARADPYEYLPPKSIVEYLESQPLVDAVEVVHGLWVSDKADILFHCSVCETQISTDWDYDDLSWNYCPNCGAKMNG